MSAVLLLLLALPLLAAAACLAAPREWVGRVAVAGGLGTFAVASFAAALHQQEAAPDLTQAPRAALEVALARRGVLDPIVAGELAGALAAGPLDAPRAARLGQELAQVELVRGHLAYLEARARAGDPAAAGLAPGARLALAHAHQEAAWLRDVALDLERAHAGLRTAATAGVAHQVKLVYHRPWLGALGASVWLGLDGLGAALAPLIALLALACLVHAGLIAPGAAARRTCAALLVAEVGLLALLVSFDLLGLVAAWLLLLVPLGLLARPDEEGRPGETAAIAAHLLLPGFAAALALLAGALALGLGGEGPPTFDLLALGERARAAADGAASRRELVVFACLFVGCAARLPILPLHGALVAARPRLSAGAGAFLQAASLLAGGVALLRVVWPLCPDVVSAPRIAAAIGLLGALHLGYGALAALGERELGRMLAWAQVALGGATLLGLAARTPDAHAGVALELIGAAAALGAASLAFGALEARTRGAHLDTLGGLARPLPRLAALSALAVLALAGLPGLVAFPARLLLLLGAGRSELLPGWLPWLAAPGLVALGVALLWTWARVFAGGETARQGPRLRDLGALEGVALVPLLAVCVLLGWVPTLALDLLVPALGG